MVYYTNGTTVDDEAERQAELDLAAKLYEDPEVRALLDELSPDRKVERQAAFGPSPLRARTREEEVV